MRWKPKVEMKLKHGDERFTYIFPIIPIKLGEYMYWMEKIHVKQRYIERETYIHDYSGIHPFIISYWENIRLSTYEDFKVE